MIVLHLDQVVTKQVGFGFLSDLLILKASYYFLEKQLSFPHIILNDFKLMLDRSGRETCSTKIRINEKVFELIQAEEDELWLDSVFQ